MSVRLRIKCPSCRRRYEFPEDILVRPCPCGVEIHQTDLSLKGKFILDYYSNGRRGNHLRKILPASVRTWPEARQIEKSFMRIVKQPECAPDAQHKIKTLKDSFLDEVDVHKLKSTAKDYRCVFNAALKYFDDKKVK